MSDPVKETTGTEEAPKEEGAKEVKPVGQFRSAVRGVLSNRWAGDITLAAILALAFVLPQKEIIGKSQVINEIKRKNTNYKEDPTTGDYFCGKLAEQVPLKPLKTFTVCGSTFEAQEDFGEIAMKVSRDMEADYQKYKEGKMSGGEKMKYWAYVQKSGGEENVRCLKVNYGYRDIVLQRQIYWNSLNDEGKKAWKSDEPIIRDKHQTFVAAPPCQSYHGLGLAVDVSNWGAAEPYFWKYNIPGGSRGIYKDPWHFSRGEFERKGIKDAAKQWGWFEVCEKIPVCKKH
ncbi:D-alanyl-D-alanine carboxypeptidase family protein [Candidatus Peregrinibacteria bacterium]|nr:D-alanyl-D-alanine carboxypeptidase family protein [Candidatus Peregrinibacteria bacterium]